MAAMVITTQYKYERGDLGRALTKMTEEANRVAADGYALVGFQVVESERSVVGLYQKVRPRAESGASPLLGD